MFGPSASTPRVKICCIANAAEIALAVAAGASAIGLVSAMPSGPGVLADDIIAHLAMLVPPPVMSVLLTSRVSTADILEQQHCCRASMLQLCDAVTPDTRRGLRDALPGVRIMQVIHVRSASSIPEAREAAETSDALVLDSGRPLAAQRTLGGTGQTHDWEISRAIRDAVDRPVFLAGGLHAENVGRAIAQVRPFGVDVCTGVRTDGLLDADKLRRFVMAVCGVEIEACEKG